jgi:hypothetical protein
MTITESVYSFKTKHPQGFTESEIEELLKQFPVSMIWLQRYLFHDTKMEIDGETITYHCDIDRALNVGMRTPKGFVWD